MLTVASGNNTFAGRIQDTLPGGSSTTALALTLGSLTLSGNNSFTGGANLNGGTLTVTGSLAAGNITTVGNTATLAGDGNGTTTGLAGIVSVTGGTIHPGIIAGDIARLTTSSMAFHTGNYSIDLGSSFTSDLLNDKGPLTIGDGSSSVLSLTVAGTPSIGNYEVIDYAAGSLTKNADFAISGPVGFNYSLDYNTAGKVFLKVTAATNILTWSGAADQTTWDFAHANFTNGTTTVAYANSSPAVFNDTAPANATTINIPSVVTPSTVSVNSTARNYTFQGAGSIGGTGNLSKDGSSKLTILNNNTYSGTTTINSGVIQVGNGSSNWQFGIRRDHRQWHAGLQPFWHGDIGQFDQRNRQRDADGTRHTHSDCQQQFLRYYDYLRWHIAGRQWRRRGHCWQRYRYRFSRSELGL